MNKDQKDQLVAQYRELGTQLMQLEASIRDNFSWEDLLHYGFRDAAVATYRKKYSSNKNILTLSEAAKLMDSQVAAARCLDRDLPDDDEE